MGCLVSEVNAVDGLEVHGLLDSYLDLSERGQGLANESLLFIKFDKVVLIVGLVSLVCVKPPSCLGWTYMFPTGAVIAVTAACLVMDFRNSWEVQVPESTAFCIFNFVFSVHLVCVFLSLLIRFRQQRVWLWTSLAFIELLRCPTEL